jgi:hypothetical protein
MASAMGYSRTQLPSGATASGVLHVNTTTVGNDANTSEKDAQTYTIGAGRLSAGKVVRITAGFTNAANANTKTGRIWFGGTTVAAYALSTNNSRSRLVAEVLVTGAAAQKFTGNAFVGNTVQETRGGTIAADTTAGIIVKATVQSGTASANDTTADWLLVEVLN